jgi:predicted RND superfamily exporter protein
MGLVLGVGVAVALILAITLTPVIFSFMRQPKPWKIEAAGIQRLVSRFLSGTEHFALNRPWVVCTVLVLVLGFSIFGLSRLTIETDFSERLDESNQIRLDGEYFNQHFCGSNFLEIFVEAPQSNGLLDPQAFSGIRAFQKKVQQLPEVDKVVSLVDLIESIGKEMNPESGKPRTAPMSREMLAQYLLLFEMSGGEDLERLIDFDRKSMRLAARLKTNAVRATCATGHKVKTIADTTMPKDIKVEPSGLNYLFGDFLDDIVAGQRLGLIVAAVVIMLLMMIWMRSVKIGLLSMIPNLIPILALGGLVGLRWDQVDSDIIAVAILALGIGVDDTIHFLMRLRFEAARSPDTVAALERTFYYSGRAIVITTIILAVGFAPFATSDYLSINMMGTLIPFTLVIALLADIFLVPAMARLGMIRFRKD